MSWYPNAVRHPGPASKVWPEPNAHVGIIEHSMEGYLGTALGMLDDVNQQVSWHFSIGKDGTVYQHYDLVASCWHAGTHAQNNRLVGVEHEGVTGEALTDSQITSSVALSRWIANECGWSLARDGANKTLWEHHEVPGASTTCPNGRIDWGRYMPQNDPNHEDGYDTGLTRIRLEDMLRILRDEHKHAEGDPQILHQIIDQKR